MMPIDIQELDIGGPMELGLSQRNKKRLYLCWRNTKGVECKMIGPETKCFCNRRFKEHNYLSSTNLKVPCQISKCLGFEYIPTHGSYDFKCLCKHSFKEHDCVTHKCTRQNCKNCGAFRSAWTCSCGQKYSEHRTIVETYEQRKANQLPLGDMDRLQAEIYIKEGLPHHKPFTVKMDLQARMRIRQGRGSFEKQEVEEEVEEYQI